MTSCEENDPAFSSTTTRGVLVWTTKPSKKRDLLPPGNPVSGTDGVGAAGSAAAPAGAPAGTPERDTIAEGGS